MYLLAPAPARRRRLSGLGRMGRCGRLGADAFNNARVRPVGPEPFRRFIPPPPPAPTNPAGGPPSTITNWDRGGNPIYATPPPGQVVVGRDAQGNPIYAQPGAGAQIVGYDSNGNPVYGSSSTSLTPPSTSIVGYDAYGNPIYAGSAAAAALATPAAAAPSVTVDSSTGYQSILDWFSEQTLITGIPNWGILAAVVGGIYFIKSRGRR